MERRAFITGAGSGIGRACAQHLAEQGVQVICADLNADAAQQTAEVTGGLAVVVDVTDAAALDELAAKLEREGGAVTDVVACAGVLQPWDRPHELSLEVFDRVIEVDFKGVFLTARAFGPRMAQRGSGSIVTISSCAAFRSTPLHAYGPAKAAVVALTETLAAEWGRSGVRVNGVAPAYTLTEVIEEQARQGMRNLSDFGADLLIGRAIRPREVAAAVGFLLSPAASAITGITLPVDGGLLASGVWANYGGPRPAYKGETL